MNKRESLRKERIKKIFNTLIKASDEGIEINDEKLIILVMSDYGVSRRIAREYIEVAKYDYGITKRTQSGTGLE